MTTLRLFAIGALAAACVSTTAGKPTHGPIMLQTAESPIHAAPCPASVIEGTLVESTVTGLGLLDDTTTGTTDVIWPYGYRATPSIGGGILFDSSGTLIAYTGERVRLEVASPASTGPLVVCGAVLRVPFVETSGAT